MNNDSKYWLILWAMVIVGVTFITIASINYWKHHNTKVVQLIEQGITPTAALCALQDDYGNHPVCIIHAINSKEKI